MSKTEMNWDIIRKHHLLPVVRQLHSFFFSLESIKCRKHERDIQHCEELKATFMPEDQLLNN